MLAYIKINKFLSVKIKVVAHFKKQACFLKLELPISKRITGKDLKIRIYDLFFTWEK